MLVGDVCCDGTLGVIDPGYLSSELSVRYPLDTSVVDVDCADGGYGAELIDDTVSAETDRLCGLASAKKESCKSKFVTSGSTPPTPAVYAEDAIYW